MKRALLPATALAFLAFCSPDTTRRSGETGMAVDTAPSGDSASPSSTAVTPAAILSELHLANTTEIQLSKLAVKQASSAAVKRIAKQLAADHSKNRQQVRALAQKLGLTLTPAAGGSIAAADSPPVPPELRGNTGADFDRAFVEHEIDEHREGIEKIQNQLLPAAQSEQVRAYLQGTVAEMQSHLASLQQVQRQLGG